MLSKEASSTIFKVFGITWPGIEPMSPWPVANALPTNDAWLVLQKLLRFIILYFSRISDSKSRNFYSKSRITFEVMKKNVQIFSIHRIIEERRSKKLEVTLLFVDFSLELYFHTQRKNGGNTASIRSRQKKLIYLYMMSSKPGRDWLHFT